MAKDLFRSKNELSCLKKRTRQGVESENFINFRSLNENTPIV